MMKFFIGFVLVAFVFSGAAFASPDTDNRENDSMARTMNITVNGRTLTARMEDNSSARALLEHLGECAITVDMSDYASMKKVGSLGFSLTRNDRPTNTTACDIILYLSLF